MPLSIVYIAGPYTAPTYYGVERNIIAAQDAAIQLVKAGYGYFCPHLNSAHFEHMLPDIPVTFWYTMDLEILRHCDAMVLLPGWESSVGTKKEHEKAVEWGIPIYSTVAKLLEQCGPYMNGQGEASCDKS